jgi:Bacteriocin-protection, YdeI or OmpD-Associated/Domain of unknown function (DUF1905)
MRFRTTLLLAGKTATGMEVPPEVVEALGGGRKPPVRVSLGGYEYRSTIAPRGERYLLGVSAENRDGAGVVAGDVLDVDLELDTEPREISLPADLAAELEGDRRAAEFFETLTYSQKRWYVLPIEQAKTVETRERRVGKAIGMLREGRKR